MIPPGWWDHFCVQEAARRCSPWDDLVGFFTALGEVTEEYVPKVREWLADHGFTAGECLDLMAETRNAVDPDDTDPASLRRVEIRSLRQLFLHGLDVDTIALMLGVSKEAVEHYILSAQGYPPAIQRIRMLHAQGMKNADIARECGVCRTTVESVLKELGLKRNGEDRLTPQQKAQAIVLQQAGKTYHQIEDLLGISFFQVKNALKKTPRKKKQ